MGIEVFHRIEKKFIISDVMYKRLRRELEKYMELDSHSRNGDFYLINNIYYDTENHELIRKSIEKPKYKEKLRLRSYGTVGLEDKVYLEIKKKVQGKGNKRRTSLKLAEAYDFLQTKRKPTIKKYMNEQVMNEIEYLINRLPLQPQLYLSYERNALNSPEDKNFRITFDTNIKTRRYDLGLEKGNYGDFLLPPGVWIMEVKMDHAAPLWFVQLLSKYKLYYTSFSKYGTEYKDYIKSIQEAGQKDTILQIQG